MLNSFPAAQAAAPVHAPGCPYPEQGERTFWMVLDTWRA